MNTQEYQKWVIQEFGKDSLIKYCWDSENAYFEIPQRILDNRPPAKVRSS